VPRSTGLLHDPANHARIRFESDGLHYLADHHGRIAAISGYMRDHLLQDYQLPVDALLDLPDGLTAHEWSYEERPPVTAAAPSSVSSASSRRPSHWPDPASRPDPGAIW